MLHSAPLAKYSTWFFMQLMRSVTRRATLWTEMVHCNIVLHRDPELLTRRYLSPVPLAGPNVLQVATSRRQDLRAALEKLHASPLMAHFEEINLNCGCPADSALSGAHGAALLQESQRDTLLGLCSELKAGARDKRASVKIRTGIAGESSYEHLRELVRAVVATGVDHIVLHARDAIIGASCKRNRQIPPIRMDWAEQLRSDVGQSVALTFNGEVKSCFEARKLLGSFDGVMMGRLAMNDPFAFIVADEVITGAATRDVSTTTTTTTTMTTKTPKRSREQVIEEYARKLPADSSVSLALSPLVNMWRGTPHNKHWKRLLSERREEESACNLIVRALEELDIDGQKNLLLMQNEDGKREDDDDNDNDGVDTQAAKKRERC